MAISFITRILDRKAKSPLAKARRQRLHQRIPVAPAATSNATELASLAENSSVIPQQETVQSAQGSPYAKINKNLAATGLDRPPSNEQMAVQGTSSPYAQEIYPVVPAKSEEAFAIPIKKSDFEPLLDQAGRPRVLGKGSFGEVVLYRFNPYSTSDEPLSEEQHIIKSLCDDDGLLVIKTGTISAAEMNITDMLYEHPDGFYNKAHSANLIAEDGREEKVLISKYQCFKRNPAAQTSKSQFKSYPLDSFLRKLQTINANEVLHIKTGATIQATSADIFNDYAIIFSQLTDSMMTSIRSMHAAGVLHLDIAPRNFMLAEIPAGAAQIKFAALAVDFGHAKQYDPSTGLTFSSLEGNVPLRAIDLATLRDSDHLCATRTDLYAYRIALLNMLTMELGFEESSAIFIKPGEDTTGNCLNRLADCKDDSDALNRYMVNLKDLILQQYDRLLRQNDPFYALYYEIKQATLQEFSAKLKQLHDNPVTLQAELKALSKAWHNNSQGYLNEVVNIEQEIENLNQQLEELNQQAEENSEHVQEALQQQQKLLAETITALGHQRDLAKKYYHWYKKLSQALHENLSQFSDDTYQNLFKLLEQQIAELTATEFSCGEAVLNRVQTFIDCYGAYLTNAPWDNGATSPDAIEEADYAALLAANEAFFLRTLAEKLEVLKASHQIDTFMLSLHRLFAITVSPGFKESVLYKKLEEILATENPHAIDIAALSEELAALESVFLSTDSMIAEPEFIETQANSNAAISTENSEIISEELQLPGAAQLNTFRSSQYGEIPAPNLQADTKGPVQAEVSDATALASPLLTAEAKTALLDKLSAINQLFKEHGRYYESAFYSKINPLRHLFVETKTENIAALARLSKALQAFTFNAEEMAELSRVALADLKPKKPADNAAEYLKAVQKAVKKLNKKHANYQRYIDLLLSSFERQLKEMDTLSRAALSKCSDEFSDFKQILLPVELMQVTTQSSQIHNDQLRQRVEALTEKIEHAQQKSNAVIDTAEAAAVSVTIRSASKLPNAKIAAEKTSKNIAEDPQRNWLSIFRAHKGWHCEVIEDNPDKIRVRPQKSELSFIADAEEKSFTYQREKTARTERSATQSAKEAKLIAEMVKAFLETGGTKADISGSPKLCHAAARLLKRYSVVTEIKVNGELIYTASASLFKRSFKKAPLP